MIEPTKKNPEITSFLEILSGRQRDGATCMLCGSPKMEREDFKDFLSWNEAAISCVCQECQDKVWV